MRIPKALLVDPERNFAFGFLALTVSFFVFAYSTHFGKPPILIYYACWLPLLVVDHRRFLNELPHILWIVPFGVFALLSTFWSAAPGVSARAGTQYLSHILCALIAARVLSPRTLVLGSLGGVAIVLTYSLAVGEYHYDPIDGSYSFVGAFSSKNQLGFFASLGVYFTYAALALLRERRTWALAAVLIGVLSLHCLIISQSATSMIAVIGTLATSMCISIGLYLRPPARMLFFAALAVLSLLGAFVALRLGAFDMILAAFGKNATLTGRTYLWSEGLEAARRNIVLGQGYQAYWVSGFSEAERLWAEFGIMGRTGFHFHSTYVETLVETGSIGLVLLYGLIIYVLVGHFMRLLNGGMIDSHLMFAVGAMLFVRSFVEVDVITPYVVGSFLLYYAAGVLSMRPVERMSGLAVGTGNRRESAGQFAPPR